VGRKPSPNLADVLAEAQSRARREELEDRLGVRLPGTIDEAKETARAATGERDAWRRLPEPVQRWLVDHCFPGQEIDPEVELRRWEIRHRDEEIALQVRTGPVGVGFIPGRGFVVGPAEDGPEAVEHRRQVGQWYGLTEAHVRRIVREAHVRRIARERSEGKRLPDDPLPWPIVRALVGMAGGRFTVPERRLCIFARDLYR